MPTVPSSLDCSFQVGVGRRGSIGQYQVEPVQRQFGQQVLDIAFDAFQAHRQRRLQHRLQQAEGDQLGYRLAEAHGEAPASRRVVGHRVAQFLAEQKYLVGIVQRGAPGLGQHQRAALRREQRLPQLLFEHAELGADGLHREIQAFRRTGDAAFLGDGPEVEQVAEIEVVRGHRQYQ
jgi:hypothetical protein